MRILESIRRRLPLALTAVSGVAITALVATVALVSQGYPQQRLDLDDGAVWVPSGEHRMIGHASTEIGALSTVLDGRESAVRLLQDPVHLIVHDTADDSLAVASPAQARVVDTVPLPNGDPAVVDGGDDLVVLQPATGDAWVVAKDDAASFEATSAPTLSLGVDAVIAADAEGRYAGYSAKSGKLATGRLDGDGPSTTEKAAFSAKPRDVQVTLVDGRPVLYNPASAELWIDGHLVPLSSRIDQPASARLMEPSTDGERVLVAHADGLVAVRLGDWSVHAVGGSAEATGNPAAPVRVDGCEYAAWSGGSGYRMCGPGSGSGVGSDQPAGIQLAGLAGASRLDLLVNGRTVVLNEPATGRTWAMQRDGRLIDNWSDFVDTATTIETAQDQRDLPPELEQQQKPPVAVDDAFGVRPGRANVLPVLLNDSDPNGDAVVVVATTIVPAEFGWLDVVADAQKIQLTLRPDASGSTSFGYTIDDGRGGTAQATVTVTVVDPGQNEGPRQVRPTRASVASGGTASLTLLGDWVDPESDPIYLKDVTVTAPDRVSFTPDGRTDLTDGGSGPGVRTAGLVVSDGSADGSGTLAITVGQPGTVPIIAESFAVTGYAGQEIAVAPLANVRGGTGTVRLSGVTPEAGDTDVSVAPDYTAGTFTATIATPGTHRVEYTVTDGKQNASAVVRLQVAAPPETVLPPITQPTTAFVYLRESTSVDVLANDVDPAGGVLSLVGLSGVPSSLSAGIVDQRMLTVTLLRALDGPVTFGYRVTNGKATATGSVTIVQVPEPTKLLPPIANRDTADVRVGSAVDIPVLANDIQPNGRPLLLADRLVQDVPSGGGTLFSAGDRLRYLAPSKPGTYTAGYAIRSTDGQTATAQVTITVRDVDAANNRAPVPRTVEARTTSGQKVRIPIPLTGIDPDGDTVTLSGQATAPRLGALSGTGDDYLEYTAGPYSTGTDTFQYTVVDALGAVGTGTVRVGVSQGSGTVAAPIAADDAVVTRPGTTLHVDVVANDTDPQGSAVMVTALEPGAGLTATHDGDTVTVTAPEREGAYAVLYTIRNERGGTASAWLYLQVAADAPLAAPVADDIRLGLLDIEGRTVVDVDALAGVTFSEGSRSALRLSVPSGFSSAQVVGDRLRIDVRAQSQIIPFAVARADDPTVRAMAFVWVPGTDGAKPELRKGAPALSVASGDRLTIPIGDRVIAANGRAARITDASGVSATYSDGGSLVVDDTTLRYTSARGYFGPASISFTVTDAADGVGGNRATFTLPITVTPKKNQPPVVNSVALTLEGGGETTVDLLALTDYPYSDARDQLTYTAESGATDVVTATVSGRSMTLRATDGVRAGRTAKVVVAVRDANGPGTSGIVAVTIVKSSRPLVSPRDDAVTIRRGGSTTVQVLADDEATNPFPGHALRVVSVDVSRVPAGIDVKASADKSSVSIAVGSRAPTGNLTIPYKVSDVTGDPDRYTSANIVVNVQDVPDAPSSAPGVGSPDLDEASVVITIPPTYPNNSPITGYTVEAVGGGPRAECVPERLCVVSGLSYGVPYRFTVRAANALGAGADSAPSAPIVVDGAPVAGTASIAPDPADRDGRTLNVGWGIGRQPAKGSAPQSVHVRVTGGGATLLDRDYPASETGERIRTATPGVSYTVTMTVANRTSSGPEATATAMAIAAPRFQSSSPTVAREGAGGWATVRWSIAPGSGDVTIRVARGEQAAGACTSAQGEIAQGDSWVDTGSIRPGAVYTVYASNALFCTAAVTGPLDLKAPVAPGMVVQLQPEDGRNDIIVQRGVGGVNISRIEYAVVPHSSREAPTEWTGLRGTRDKVTGPGTDIPDGVAYRVYTRACGSFECTPPQVDGDDGTLIPGPIAAPDPTTTRGTPPGR